ncbi:NADH-quinone oxidoreductase subunit NuoE [Oricola sp.]|uniref:NADH-quinone oxidoreductase subunit NuoE n=1 Tax=Oricola sp. TaxID=1979950 RepID=UPI0025F927BB|nr:NADH-quinone oxidoreductase subunit NuoE [Oricola sp.]MCI5075780.1 NADH-quinone oxidoreductase subunit NuoE [Oricola sp.]
MSVRRLAEENVQPAEFAFNPAMSAEAEKWIGKYPEGRQQSAVIPLLMLAQEQDGWVTRAAIEHVAAKLDMPKIRVLEVATFYTQFMLQPVGTKAHVQVCGTTPCMLRGAEDLKRVCQNKIAHDPFALNGDGTLSWEEVECQGACVNAPMVMIGKDTYEDLTPERLEEIIDAFEAGNGDTITPGPQIDRAFSAPAGGLTTLTDDGPATPGYGSDASSTIKVAATASSLMPKVKPVEQTVEGGNPTMKLAATASGRAKAPDAEEAASDDAEPALDDANRPAGIDKPDQPDDLKLISGVGPKIEGVLNSLGIYTFAQVAQWNEAERAWVDSYLKFKGRIDRDEWVKQADALSKGPEEYARVFGKEPR